MVMGVCISGPVIWNLLRRAPDRIVAAVLAQPSGSRPEMRDRPDCAAHRIGRAITPSSDRDV